MPTTETATATATELESRNNVQVPAPEQGAAITVTSEPGGNLVFGFDPATATATRPEGGNDLVFELDGGGRVTIGGFFEVGDNTLPDLTLPDGTMVAATDFFAGSDLDMATAAGPGAGSPDSGGTNYSDDGGALLAGLDKYGALGTDYWGRGIEAAEEFQGLLAAEGDLGLTLPGAPGGGDDTTPGGGEEPKPELHAHDNQGTMAVSPGYSSTYTPGKTTPGEVVEKPIDNNDGTWKELTGKLDSHQVPGTGKIYGLMSPSGKGAEVDFGNFDLRATLRAEDGFESWSVDSNNSNIAAALSTKIEVPVTEGGTHTITANWAMYPNNSGGDGDNDATLAILYRVVGGELVYVGHEVLRYVDYEDGKPQANKNGFAEWVVNEPGEYVIMYVVAEAGGNSGQKTILGIDPGSYEYQGEPVVTDPVFTETYDYTIAAAGNVITELDRDGEAGHDRDHHSDSSLDKTIQVTGVTIGGVALEWNEEAQAFTTGEDSPYSFRMDSDGYYEFTASGTGHAPSLEDLEITYEITSGDGETDTAKLTLEPNYNVVEAAEPGYILGTDGADIIYGSAGNDTIEAGEGNDVVYGGLGDDIIYAGSGDNLIYGGAGSDTMHGGEGNDTFAWAKGDLDGSTDTIIGFDLGQDVLRFDDLLGLDTGDKVTALLLKGATLTLAPDVDNTLLLTLGEDYKGQQIEINLTNGLDKSMADALNNGDAAMQAAVLEQLLTSS